MKHGCHNKRNEPGYWAQDGWEVVEVDGRNLRIPKAVWITDVLSKQCRYDKRNGDRACEGCGTEWDVEYLEKQGLM